MDVPSLPSGRRWPTRSWLTRWCNPTPRNGPWRVGQTRSGSGRRRGVAIGIAGGLLAGTAAGLVFGVPGSSSAASDSTPAAVIQQTDETDPAAPVDAPETDEAPEMGTKLREVLQPLVDDGTITSHVKRIRRKFGAVDPDFDRIDTVYGMGYRWKADD